MMVWRSPLGLRYAARDFKSLDPRTFLVGERVWRLSDTMKKWYERPLSSARLARLCSTYGGGFMKCRLALVLGTLLLTAATNAAGQGFQGGLRGAVHDPNGVVPGVEVTI